MASCSIINSWLPNYYYVSDELKRFADFHIGSYWIYKNDSLSVYDTVRVVDYQSVLNHSYSDEDEFYDERIEISFKSSYDSTFSRQSSIIDNLKAINDFKRSRMIAGTSWKEVEFWLGINTYSFDYELNGIKYDTIIYHQKSIPTTYPLPVGPRSVEYYFSLDHGAIRKVYQEDSSRMDWYLVDYHIVR